MPYLVGTEYEPIMLPRECIFRKRLSVPEYGDLVLVDIIPPLPGRFSHAPDDYATAEHQVQLLALQCRWPGDNIFPQSHTAVPVQVFVATMVGDALSTEANYDVRLVLEATLYDTRESAQRALPSDVQRRRRY